MFNSLNFVLFQTEELDELRDKIHNLEIENSKLKYTNLKHEEDLEDLSSRLAKETKQTTAAPNPETNRNESPDRFEIIDGNSSIFKEDNISNSSFNAGEWMNLSIPADNRDFEVREEGKPRDAEVRVRLVLFFFRM